jgi:hypothetical protein
MTKISSVWNPVHSLDEAIQQAHLIRVLSVARCNGWAAAWEYGHDGTAGLNQYKARNPHALQPVPELEWLHAVPNGGSRGDTKQSAMIEGNAMKASGVKSGIPDLCWPIARSGYHGLYLEMKSPRHRGTPSWGLSEQQIACLTFLDAQGYCTRVAFDWREAFEKIKAYYCEF